MNFVLIPEHGLMQILQADAEPAELLDAYDGAHGRIGLHDIIADFVVGPESSVNPKAREFFHHLTGVHVMFVGPVLFSGLNLEQIFGYLQDPDGATPAR